MAEIRIGCSGYYYPAWKGTFYPSVLQPNEWLSFYSTQFNAVELNGTFYRQPRLADLIRSRTATAPNFQFSVKMSRYLTHILRMHQAKEKVLEFQDLIRSGLHEKLTHFLFQFPASFRYSEDRLDDLLNALPHHPENVIEFRHQSWWNTNVFEAFKNAELTFCNMDYPGLEVSFQQTNNEFYLRLHGNPILFRSPYSSEKLQYFASKLPAVCKKYHLFFNNTDNQMAFDNAREMMELTGM
ncbi:MAG: DUF72 domain-containing protein [Chitinophagales bacterium]